MTSSHLPTDPDVQTRFLSLVSHEFRTPLTVILSSTELLEGYGDSMPAQRKQSHFRRIHSAVGTMTALLDNVSLLARFDSGEFEPKREPLQLSGVVSSLLEEVEPFQKSGQDLHVRCPPGLVALLDLRLVRACLVNLLSNALRFSEENSTIEIDVRPKDRGLLLSVADQGGAFPWSEADRLWEPFERGSNATGISGSGLGLSIVRRCATLSEGFADLSPRPGGGTLARVYLPAEITA
ncbi:MAG TPA: HAMP domain-containing sensor histidine kinase [Fibrobacteria bacterium]|nr:HAMP domain-containing sensor histidine kinase [Fibrobacteria bacterium]HOX51384.1 HAMP domain-containing sensor histidine kinase [Fibrobacteria bacterium]